MKISDKLKLLNKAGAGKECRRTETCENKDKEDKHQDTKDTKDKRISRLHNTDESEISEISENRQEGEEVESYDIKSSDTKSYPKSKKNLWLLIILALTVCMGIYEVCKKADLNKPVVTITVGDIPDEKSKPVEYDMFMKIVDNFEKKNPDIKIELVNWGFNSREYMAKAEGGTLPDVYQVPMTENTKIMKLGYAADITEIFKERGYLRNTSELIMREISKDGRIYFIPAGLYDVGIVVNMEIMRRAGLVDGDDTPKQPQTWEELAEMARLIKEKTNIPGFAIPTITNGAGWRFTPIAWSYDTVFETRDSDGRVTASFNSAECTEALQYVKDLRWKYDVLPHEKTLSSDDVQKMFANGEVGMIFAETGSFINIVGYGMQKESIGIIKLPAGPAKRVSLVGGSYYVINKEVTDRQAEAAFKWIEYSTGNYMLVDDEAKLRIREKVEENEKIGTIIGLKTLSPWKEESDLLRYRELVEYDCSNVDRNHIRLYNNKEDMEFQTEEQTEAQMLYLVLGDCVNKVLNDENVNPAEILAAANSEFQTKYLDYAE